DRESPPGRARWCDSGRACPGKHRDRLVVGVLPPRGDPLPARPPPLQQRSHPRPVRLRRYRLRSPRPGDLVGLAGAEESAMSDPLVDPLAPPTLRGRAASNADPAAASDATPPPPGRDPLRLRGGALQRFSRQRLAELAERLSQRDRQIVATIAEFRLLRGDQIRRLFFSQISTEGARARICRRSLQMLVDAKLLH